MVSYHDNDNMGATDDDNEELLDLMIMKNY